MFNKLNVLHWHIMDEESFPLEVETLPDLAKGGAFHPQRAKYDAGTVQEIVRYGNIHGVRVLPEVSVPGRCHSWRFADHMVSIVADCPNSVIPNSIGGNDISSFLLDPSKERTFEVISEVWKQINKSFSDEFAHIGAGGVLFGIWPRNPSVAKWMQQRGFSTGTQVFQYFMNRTFQKASTVTNKRFVVWEDAFNANVTIPTDAVIQVSTGEHTLKQVIAAGYSAISSYGWHLNKQKPHNKALDRYDIMDGWKDYYKYEPTKGLSGPGLNLSLLLGGEALMWGAQVDEMNIEQRIWPKACAIAERLWSDKSVTNLQDATARLGVFRCSLARRGVRAGPIAPDYCLMAIESQFTKTCSGDAAVCGRIP